MKEGSREGDELMNVMSHALLYVICCVVCKYVLHGNGIMVVPDVFVMRDVRSSSNESSLGDAQEQSVRHGRVLMKHHMDSTDKGDTVRIK